MNKASISALVVAVLALVIGGAAFVLPHNSKIVGSYIPIGPQFSSGFTQVISTSSVLSTATFCNPSNVQYLGSAAAVTSTMPAATTTFAACGAVQNFGAQVLSTFTNDSTNTVALIPGTGVTIKCPSAGGTTSTLSAGICASNLLTIAPSTTVQYGIYFDTNSSTLKVFIDNISY